MIAAKAHAATVVTDERPPEAVFAAARALARMMAAQHSAALLRSPKPAGCEPPEV